MTQNFFNSGEKVFDILRVNIVLRKQQHLQELALKKQLSETLDQLLSLPKCRNDNEFAFVGAMCGGIMDDEVNFLFQGMLV